MSAALQQMASAPRTLTGSAFWKFGDDQLVIRWTSYEQAIDVRDGSPLEGAIKVPGRFMDQLGAVVDLTGDTEIRWLAERDRLRVGRHLIPASFAEEGPIDLLPLDAQERDLLKQILRRGMERVSLAGYEEEAGEAEARWDKSLKAASSALEWTGLSGRALEAVVSELIINDLEWTEDPLFVLPDRGQYFDPREYPEPLKMMMAIYRAMDGRWWSFEDHRASLLDFLKRCPGGADLLAESFCSGEAAQEEIHALYEAAVLHRDPQVVEGHLEAGIRAGIPEDVFRDLLDLRVSMTGSLEDMHRSSQHHPLRGVIHWMSEVVPHLYPDAADRIRWFVEKLGGELRFIPRDLADDLTERVGEWIQEIGSDQVEEVVAKLQDHELLDFEEIHDALDEVLGELDIGWEDVVKTS
ncbi:MAG: hypothetical protein ABIK09_15135 [Pseudomonadota bacterium]